MEANCSHICTRCKYVIRDKIMMLEGEMTYGVCPGCNKNYVFRVAESQGLLLVTNMAQVSDYVFNNSRNVNSSFESMDGSDEEEDPSRRPDGAVSYRNGNYYNEHGRKIHDRNCIGGTWCTC